MANPNAGRFTWHELTTADPAATAKFYVSLFGWTVKEMDMGPAGTYRMFMKGETAVGGAMAAPKGVPSHWLSYVGCENADATAKKITELGGKLLVPVTEVPNMVRFAVGLDPQHAAFGVVQGIGPQPEPPAADAPPVLGTFCWDELHTKDMDASGKYYGSLFGWTGSVTEGPMKYWHWKNAGRDIGGMMTLMAPNVPPHWLAYIAASDVDTSTAKVRELGGKVVMEPMEVEKVGKFSVVQDTSGATFALFRSARV
jgi:predicted enzyme related to lactoylglutathione lyase